MTDYRELVFLLLASLAGFSLPWIVGAFFWALLRWKRWRQARALRAAELTFETWGDDPPRGWARVPLPPPPAVNPSPNVTPHIPPSGGPRATPPSSPQTVAVARHRGIVRISPELLTNVLQLSVRDIRHISAPDRQWGCDLELLVEHPDFPNTPEGMMLPRGMPVYRVDQGRVTLVSIDLDFDPARPSTQESFTNAPVAPGRRRIMLP